MKKIIKMTEQDLHMIVKESVQNILKEGENGGWIVDTSEVHEAYKMAVEEFGEEDINAAIVRCLGDETLSNCLAYIFRMYDFRKWKSRFEN